MLNSKLPVVCIMGPTGVGKTDLAINLASNMSCHLISIDSVLIYRGMNIGAAKPAAAVLARYPHALIDIIEPHEIFSVYKCIEAVSAEISIAHQQNKLPVLVGGTMMYHYALQFGIHDLPESKTSVREQIAHWQKYNSDLSLWDYLVELDQKSAEKIDQNDQQRITRALEMVMITNHQQDALLTQKNFTIPLQKFNTVPCFMLPPDRAHLYQRLNNRFDQMMELGLLSEIEHLMSSRYFDPDLPAYRAVGYRQLIQYVLGNQGLESATEAAKTATRRLAKRQITWMNKWKNAENIVINDQKQQDNFVSDMVNNFGESLGS